MATKAAIRDETRKRPTTAQSGPARVDEARSDQDVASELTATHRWTSLDVGLFEFGFVLVVIGTFLSARSRDPVFWLLAGPGLTAAVITMIMFIRQGFGRGALIRILKRHGPGITPPLPPATLREALQAGDAGAAIALGGRG